jgi:hypothetical protein
MEKLAQLLEHWPRHNQDHVSNYLDWADRAETDDNLETAELLRQAAETTERVTKLFTLARAALSP